jgi:hypothetical protein
MSRASGKFSAALKSSRGQCLPVDFSKWRLVYFGKAAEESLSFLTVHSGRREILGEPPREFIETPIIL